MKIIGICGLAGSGKDTVANYISKEYGYVQVALADSLKRFVKQVFAASEVQLWGSSSFRNVKAVPNWSNVDLAFSAYYKEWLVEITRGGATSTHEEGLHEWYKEFKRSACEDKGGETSARIILQSLGTEWGRETYFENLWIDYALDVVIPKVIQPAYIYSKTAGLLKQSAPPGVVISDIRFTNELEQLSKRGGKIVKLNRKSLDDDGEPGITNHQSEAEQKTMSPDLFSMILSNDGTIEDLYKNVDVFMQCV